MTISQLRDRLAMSEDAAARPDYADLVELLDDAKLDDTRFLDREEELRLMELIEDGEFLGLLAH